MRVNIPPGSPRTVAAALLLAALGACGQRPGASPAAGDPSGGVAAESLVVTPATAVQRFAWQQLAGEARAHFLAERGREPQSPRALLEWLQDTRPAADAEPEEREFWARRAGAALGAALVENAAGTWQSEERGATAHAAVLLPDGRAVAVERFAREVAAGATTASLAGFYARHLAPTADESGRSGSPGTPTP